MYSKEALLHEILTKLHCWNEMLFPLKFIIQALFVEKFTVDKLMQEQFIVLHNVIEYVLNETFIDDKFQVLTFHPEMFFKYAVLNEHMSPDA